MQYVKLKIAIATVLSPEISGDDPQPQSKSAVPRRSFLKGVGMAGVALSAGSLLPEVLAQAGAASITKGDAAILRFLAAAEIIETDLWQQYNELAGIQDSEVPGGSGNEPYSDALEQLDDDMPQYIHDNTEDELTHEVFINAYPRGSRSADRQPRCLPYAAQQQGNRRAADRTLDEPDAAHGRYLVVHPLPQPHQESRLR